MAQKLKVDVGIHKKGCRVSIKPDFQSAFGITTANRQEVAFALKDFDNATGKLHFDVGVDVTGTRIHRFSNSEAILTADAEMRVTLTSEGSMIFRSNLEDTFMQPFDVGRDEGGYFIILPLSWFEKQTDNLFARLMH